MYVTNWSIDAALAHSRELLESTHANLKSVHKTIQSTRLLVQQTHERLILSQKAIRQTDETLRRLQRFQSIEN